MRCSPDHPDMCNLYRMRASTAEVANLFGAPAPAAAPNVAAEIYPGYPGLVVAEGQVRAMAWGFPLALKSRKTGQPLKPRPVNNAREDKLMSGFWRDSFIRRRCLIPVTAWAEAEGERGRMTRTWYALAGPDLFAVAGLWRATAEWGDAYSMVMVDGCPQMADAHDRMPLVLPRSQWREWTGGTVDQAIALCRTCPDVLTVDQTAEPWAAPRGTAGSGLLPF